jgi:hypothetical protein
MTKRQTLTGVGKSASRGEVRPFGSTEMLWNRSCGSFGLGHLMVRIQGFAFTTTDASKLTATGRAALHGCFPTSKNRAEAR